MSQQWFYSSIFEDIFVNQVYTSCGSPRIEWKILYFSVWGQYPTGINHDVTHQYFWSEVTSKSTQFPATMYILTSCSYMKCREHLMGDVILLADMRFANRQNHWKSVVNASQHASQRINFDFRWIFKTLGDLLWPYKVAKTTQECKYIKKNYFFGTRIGNPTLEKCGIPRRNLMSVLGAVPRWEWY
jgi:hypothetical protein